MFGTPGAPGADGLPGTAGAQGPPGFSGEDGDSDGSPLALPGPGEVTKLQGFPGGTSTFLRADGAFAAPTAAAGDLDLPETGSLTVATVKYHITGPRHSAAGAQRVTVAGTGRWRLMN